MSKDSNEIYEFGPFRLNVGEHKFERSDGAANGSLSEKAFQTLVALVRNQGSLVTKNELFDLVWPDTIVEENNLEKSIHQIRHALHDSPAAQQYIETIRKHGYRFVAEVRRIDDLSRSLESKTSAASISIEGHQGDKSILADTAAGKRFGNAFEAYQHARIKYHQVMAPDAAEARVLVSEALRLDPRYTPAHALSAELTTLEVIVGLKHPSVGFPEARASIARAAELGANNEEFYAASGYVSLIADWDFAAAEQNLRKALAINPHHSISNRMMGETFMFQGRRDEAAPFIKRAQVDQLTLLASANILAISHFLARDFPAVIEVCEQMLAIYPSHIIAAWTRCWAQEQMGLADEAIAGYERILRQPNGEPAFRWIGYAYAIAGDRRRALETAARLESAGLEHIVSPTHPATIYAALNEPEKAVSHIEKALEMRDPFMLWIATDPRFDNLRGHPRFDEIVKCILTQKAALPAYERQGIPPDVKNAEAVATAVPNHRITASGQHALLNLSEWRTVIERLDKQNEPQLSAWGISRLKVFNAVNGDSQAANQTMGRVPNEKKDRFPAIAVSIAMLGVLLFSGWYLNGLWQTAETPVLPTASRSENLSAENLTAYRERSPAHDLYVRGKVKMGSENREVTEAAIKVLEEAVAIDPNFAEAYAQLARAYNTMSFKYNSDAERKRFHENAEVAIEKALALNPNLAEGHLARGLILWTNTKGFPHEQAIQSYKRSLTLDPNLDETHHQLSMVYSHIGFLDEAQQSVKNALAINPNNTLARYRVGVYTAYQGKFADAIAIYKTIPRDTTPLLVDRAIAEVLIQTGRLSEAEAIADDYLSRFPKDEGGSFTSVKALLLAKAGNRKEAEDAVSRAVRIGSGFGHFHHTAYNIASAYAAMEKPDEAVKWLEKAAENGFPNYPYFEIDPNLKNIRKHPRFTAFMRKLKPQWERFKAFV